MKIAFIGAGRMAEALIARLCGVTIIASDINAARLTALKRKYKIRIAKDNRAAFAAGDVVILAVKPQQMGEVLLEITRNAQRVTRKKKIIISIAAGIPLKYLEKKLPGYSIIRAMPNNPCLVGAGITALSRKSPVARKIFENVGEVAEVPEKLLDAVTGLSGSGPAYIYLVLEALTKGGVKAGLPKPLASELALLTVAGAAAAVCLTGLPPEKLREMVTSPGGTTLEGLAVLTKYKTDQAFSRAVQAAAKKSKLLSRRFAK